MTTILLSAESPTVLDSYSDLLAAFTGYAHSTNLTTMFPTFLLLAEERINRLVRCRDMEVDLIETAITSGAIDVPAGTVGVKSMWVVGYETTPLGVVNLDQLKTRGSDRIAKVYTWNGDQFLFDGTGNVEGVLYEKISGISATEPTNWLIQKHPSCYLSAVLAEAFIYKRDDVESTRWDQRFLAIVREINQTTERDTYSGALQVRAR
jgi:hypothetical protein